MTLAADGVLLVFSAAFTVLGLIALQIPERLVVRLVVAGCAFTLALLIGWPR